MSYSQCPAHPIFLMAFSHKTKNCPKIQFEVKFAYAAITLLSDENVHDYIIRYNSDEYTLIIIVVVVVVVIIKWD
jgi:hypothetical protein